MDLTQDQINQYRAMGYSDSVIAEALDELKKEGAVNQPSTLQQSFAQAQLLKAQDPRNMSQASMFRVSDNMNMIEKQLEVNDILERVEHILRGDKLKFKDGHMIWTPCEDDDDRDLNDKGVDELMDTLSMYVNKNTLLSNYDEETINAKVYDLGVEMSDVIFMKYEEFGMTTLEKRKKYFIIVRQIVDTVHSAYLRALNGGERDSLREARTVTQMENLQPQGMGMGMNMQMQKRSPLNPMRWLGGKYK